MKIASLLLLSLLFSGCTFNKNYQAKYDNPVLVERRIKDNVMIKNKTDNLIAYKYKNVRVDEVAGLAATYCGELGLQAYLRDVVLDPQNYRIATFDCIVLNY